MLNFLLLTAVLADKSVILDADTSPSAQQNSNTDITDKVAASCEQSSSAVPVPQPMEDSYDKNVYLTEIAQYADIVLPYNADKDSRYLEQTLFVGDSNTAGLASFGYMPLQNVLGKKSMGIQGVVSNNFVWFKNYSQAVNIVKAVRLLKPRRIIINFGTNNTIGITANEFKNIYRKALYAISQSYPYCDIIVAAVLPVGYRRENYNIKQKTIDDFNIALAQLCSENGYFFLDYSEVFKDCDTGYMQKNCVAADGVHLNSKGYGLLLEYVNDHQLKTKDRRPDTDNIPARISTPQTVSELPQTVTAEANDVPATDDRCENSNIDSEEYLLDNNEKDTADISCDEGSANTVKKEITSGSSSDLGNINSEKQIYDPFL